MSAAVPVSPVVAAILAKLTADLPSSYKHFDAQGPSTPADDVPYTVVYADAGMGDGAPMQVNRELLVTFSVRCVGSTAGQSRAAGDRVRGSLEGVSFAAGGRSVYTWVQQVIPVVRDDSVSPVVLFEHLIVFGLRSTL